MLAPWRDLVRLTRKTPVISEDASIVSRIAPALGLGATLAAASLVPSFALGMALTHVSDVLVIVSLLTLARLAAGLAALDAGSALPGLAAQNASAMAVLAEPALMLCVVTLGLMGGSFNLDLIIGQQREGLLLPAGASAIVATAMLALILGEASSGVPALEHLLSGVDLAVARMSGSLRRLVWVDLIGGLFLPMGMASTDSGLVSWLIGLAAWAIKLAAFILGLTTIHSLLGRIPRHSLPDIIGVAALLALLAVVIVLASAGSA
jgi:formate hydrogenlyase subunit 4